MKIINRSARFDYEIKDTIEAGIVLLGSEVKSIRNGGVDMGHAVVKIVLGKRGALEAYVYGMVIAPYKHADNTNYDPQRKRKLLMHSKELLSIQSRMRQARLLLVPTSIYTHSGKIKLEVGMVRGKKKFEKRESIKKQDLDRDMERGV